MKINNAFQRNKKFGLVQIDLVWTDAYFNCQIMKSINYGTFIVGLAVCKTTGIKLLSLKSTKQNS